MGNDGRASMNLSTQSKKCAIVIQISDYSIDFLDTFHENLFQWLNINCEEWYAIWHLLDLQDDGTPKNPHLHLVLKLLKRTRFNTILNDMARNLNLNKNAISIQKPTSYEGCIQYLIHKNDPDKYQYPIEDVQTSVSRDELKIIMEADFVTMDADAIIAICREEKTYTAILRRIGLGYFNHYKGVIKTIFEESHPFVTPNGEVRKIARS